MVKEITKDELSLRGVSRGTESAFYKVKCKKVLVFGDPHFSGVYQGTHIDYQKNCADVMHSILEKVRNEEDDVAVIFLGDVIGVKERNIKDHRFLAMVFHFFKMLNELTNGDVLSVRGNHDFGEYPDFALLESLNLIKNPDYIDFMPNGEDIEARFHIVNYGDEYRELDLANDESISDVILGHNDYTIEGVTDWYGGHNVIDVKSMHNFVGAQLIISGHIHTPSPEIYETFIGSDHPISLYYPGCPTRVSERYDDCYYVKFEYDGNGTEMSCLEFGLPPASEIFHEKVEVDNEEVAPEESLRNERLTDILAEIREKKIFNGDIESQVKAVPHATEEAKELALEYLSRANN